MKTWQSCISLYSYDFKKRGKNLLEIHNSFLLFLSVWRILLPLWLVQTVSWFIMEIDFRHRRNTQWSAGAAWSPVFFTLRRDIYAGTVVITVTTTRWRKSPTATLSHEGCVLMFACDKSALCESFSESNSNMSDYMSLISKVSLC